MIAHIVDCGTNILALALVFGIAILLGKHEET